MRKGSRFGYRSGLMEGRVGIDKLWGGDGKHKPNSRLRETIFFY